MEGEIFRVTWFRFYQPHLRYSVGINPLPGSGGPPTSANPRPALDNPFGRIGLHGVTMKRYVVGFSKGASAVSVNVSGTWTSTIPGQGAVTDIGPYTIYDDVSLVLTQTGNGVSGRITLTKDHVEKNDPGWPDYSEPMDTSETLDVTGTVNGNIFSLSIPAVSGLTLVCTITNDRMQGSDSYLGATSETNHDHRFDLQERWY